MTIVKLHQKEIDPEKWNSLLKRTVNPQIYSDYYYLSAINPNWSALIQTDNSDYIAAFPICEKQIFGINYLVQPVLIQQFQILSISDQPEALFVSKLAQTLGNFPSIRIKTDWRSAAILQDRFAFSKRTSKTYVMDLRESTDFSKTYSQNVKRNTKKAEKFQWDLDINRDFRDLLEGFLEYKADQLKSASSIKSTFSALIPFLESCRSANVYSAKDENGKRIASALFIGYLKKAYFLFSFSSSKAKENGLMHALIDFWLRNESGDFDFLDFE